MNVFLAVLVAFIALAIVGIAVYAIRSAGQSASRSRRHAERCATRPMPQVSDFHVKGSTASVVFGVPLGDEEAGEHLTELLCASAVEYVRQKVAEGLPLEGVDTSPCLPCGRCTRYLDTVDLADGRAAARRGSDPATGSHRARSDCRSRRSCSRFIRRGPERPKRHPRARQRARRAVGTHRSPSAGDRCGHLDAWPRRSRARPVPRQRLHVDDGRQGPPLKSARSANSTGSTGRALVARHAL